ncbi:hypothetical protein HDE_09372 [Halotydeus destructor]|nr:hypothetical protein HDE_09372 [Halotydeus destructor]
MSWIVPYLDHHKLQLHFDWDLIQLYGGLENVGQKRWLKLDQLMDDELISIFSWLKPKTLVGIERVSKQFFNIVALTFRQTKQFHVDDLIRETLVLDGEKVEEKVDVISLLYRFGPGLQTLPFHIFTNRMATSKHLTSLDERFFMQLAWRFPEVSSVGRLSENTITCLLTFLKASKKESTLSKLFIALEFTGPRLKKEPFLRELRKHLMAVIARCPRLDKVKLETCIANKLSLFGEAFSSEFGLLSFELATMVNRLALLGRAAGPVKEHFSRHTVSCQELRLQSIYDHCTASEVSQLCVFAPKLKKLSLRAEVSVLKHLIVLEELEDITLLTLQPHDLQFPASATDARESMETFLKTSGRRLKKVNVHFHNPAHTMPVTTWLTKYCPNILKLRLSVLDMPLELSELRLNSMTRCEIWIVSAITQTIIDEFVRNNAALQFIKFRCFTTQTCKRLAGYFSQTCSGRRGLRSLTVHIWNVNDEKESMLLHF